MNKIGFRCSWIQEEAETQQEKIETFQVTPAMEHIAELQTRLENLETFMTTSRFAKLTKEVKAEVIRDYGFLLKTLMVVQPGSIGGLSEFATIDVSLED